MNAVMKAKDKVIKGITMVPIGKTYRGVIYSIATKVKVCEYALAHPEVTRVNIASIFNISKQTLLAWLRSYREGKFSLENSVAVAQKKTPASPFSGAIKELNKQITSKQSELNELLVARDALIHLV